MQSLALGQYLLVTCKNAGAGWKNINHKFMDIRMGKNKLHVGGLEQKYIFVFQNKTNYKALQYKSLLSSHN